MNVPGTESLSLLLERERADRDAAAAALRQAHLHAERMSRQVAHFERHRADYAARWQGEFQRSGGIEIVQCYRSFMQRLDQAVGQLQLQQSQAQAALTRAQALLADAERRVAAIEKLLARRAAQHRLRLHRDEQKLTDEAAQRSAWQVRPGGALAAVTP